MSSHGIVEALGGRAVFGTEPGSVLQWVRRIQGGLPYTCASAFKETLGLTPAELAAVLGLGEGALARLEQANRRLNLVSSDRLVRAARLHAIATEVLEDPGAAARWLNSAQATLSGAIPLRLAETDVGCRAVEVVLGRLEHGVYG